MDKTVLDNLTHQELLSLSLDITLRIAEKGVLVSEDLQLK